MNIIFDPAKKERNIHDRNPPFEFAAEFENARVQTDVRREYGKTRYVALGDQRDATVPLFDTTYLHARGAAEWALAEG